MKAFSYATKVFFVSKRNQLTAEKHLGCTLQNALVVRNPVNIKSTDIVSYPPINGVINFAMVGNLLVIHKGQDMVLEVLKKNQWLSRDWHLNIYGSGGDEAYLQQLARKYRIDLKITFHGKVADIRAVWADNHFLLMPSLMEGMPLAVVEAMICGRPSVVTDVGGHKEWITEGREGFIAESASADSIERAMERAWENRAMWQQMGAAAHVRALALFDPDPGQTLLNYLTK